MNEIFELIHRYINIKSKNLLLINESKDLNNKVRLNNINALIESTNALCNSLLKELENKINEFNNENIDKIIKRLNDESNSFSNKVSSIDSQYYYRTDAYNCLIDYLNNYKNTDEIEKNNE